MRRKPPKTLYCCTSKYDTSYVVSYYRYNSSTAEKLRIILVVFSSGGFDVVRTAVPIIQTTSMIVYMVQQYLVVVVPHSLYKTTEYIYGVRSTSSTSYVFHFKYVHICNIISRRYVIPHTYRLIYTSMYYLKTASMIVPSRVPNGKAQAFLYTIIYYFVS